MNLSKLFEMQKALDEKIIKEKGLEGQDLLPQKILALQVELGECANEWRGFKFWSKDQKARIEKKIACPNDENPFADCECGNCNGSYITVNPLLEEYVDCLHFILSIGIEMGYSEKTEYEPSTLEDNDITQHFNTVFMAIGNLSYCEHRMNYAAIVRTFMQLGEMLGFTCEQIEQAYLQKNEVNHQRQQNGY